MHVIPFLHMCLGVICDTVNRFQGFIIPCIYDYDEDELIFMAKVNILEKELMKISTQIKDYESAQKYYFDWSKEAMGPDEKRVILIMRNECIEE